MVEGNLRKLLLGEDPFDIERLWDIMWRAGQRAFHHGEHQQPVGRAVHARIRLSARDLRCFEEDNQLSRGPEGIYMRPSERPGFGWDREVVLS